MDESSDPNKTKVTFAMWDLGGQRVFYAFQHIFLTEFGVYLVVFKLTDWAGPKATASTRKESLSYIRFWLRSVKMHAPEAPVFIAGTRTDGTPSS